MRAHRAALALLLAVAVPAFAQKDDDAPIPYDDEGASEERDVPKKSRRSERIREEEEEAEEMEESMSSIDDPNYGLSGEVLLGAMLFESSRGGGVDGAFMGGLRFTWEWGRLIPDEYLREMFFADLTWQYAVLHDGTAQVYADAHQHFITLSPAIAYPFGKSPIAVYGQLGIGFNVDNSVVFIDKAGVALTGTKFLLQYGVGLRFRPSLVQDDWLRLSFRVELTRFLRGYMHDTFLGGSVGVTF